MVKFYRWTAKIDGVTQEGHVSAATASDAAEAWADKQWPPRDYTIQVQAEGFDRVWTFTAEPDVSYMVFAEGPDDDDEDAWNT